MNKTTRNILINFGINLNEYTYINKTCDNIKLKHKKTGKFVDIRW